MHDVYNIKMGDKQVLIPLIHSSLPTSSPEMLRLNTTIAPPAAASQNPLGAAVDDNAGLLNGRRPADDDVDLPRTCTRRRQRERVGNAGRTRRRTMRWRREFRAYAGSVDSFLSPRLQIAKHTEAATQPCRSPRLCSGCYFTAVAT